METVKRAKDRKAFGHAIEKADVKIQIGARGQKISPSWIAVDLFDKSPIIDFNWDVHCLPIEDDSIDCYMSNAVLEHVSDPALAVYEMHRTLRAGGHVWVEVPFLQFYHAHPADYWRWTVPGIRLFMEDFEEVGSGIAVGISHEVSKVFDHTSRALQDNAAPKHVSSGRRVSYNRIRRLLSFGIDETGRIPSQIVEWFQTYDKKVSNPWMYSSVYLWGKKTQSMTEEKRQYMKHRRAEYVNSQKLPYAPNEKVNRQRLVRLVENFLV